MLSRAFRNRFIELHCEDLPPKELVDILHECCVLSRKHARMMVAVMAELQVMHTVLQVASSQGAICFYSNGVPHLGCLKGSTV